VQESSLVLDGHAPGPRRGIVLGGGGVLGGTWAVGALLALEEEFGFAAGSADVLVGTSAGAVLAAMLGAGVTPEQLRQRYNDEVVQGGPLAGLSWNPDAAIGGHRPGLPRALAPGSMKLIGRGLRHPAQVPGTALVAALMPEGAKTMAGVGRLIDAVSPMGGWSRHGACWIVAMDYETGRRTVFGRSGSVVAPLASAVMASCSIPGWFAPVEIGGRRFIDGGAISATSVDVVEHAGLDEVYVIAPMVSFQTDNPSSTAMRLERRWREVVTKACLAEANAVARAGATVRVIGPGPEDLEAIGANMMDASQRRAVLATSVRTSSAAWRSATVIAATDRAADPATLTDP
jgi:NTE family protein